MTNISKSVVRALRVAATLLFLFQASTLTAQENRATITGAVTDSSNASTPGVRVEATNVDTGVIYPTVTNDAGVYTIPLVPPGKYSVTAALEGFQTVTRQELQVRTGDRVQVDFKMQVGAVSESLTVTAQAPLLETATASRGVVVAQEQVNDLPITVRTAILFATLAPGVQYTGLLASQMRPFDGPQVEGFVRINGGRSGRNNYLLNGITNAVQESAGTHAVTAFSPPPDAISEVRVQTNDFAAEFGHTGGGTVNVNVKSGTNRFHGSTYYYYQDTNLRANTFTNKQAGLPIAPFHWKEPGLELDGPVHIPNVYDGRNRTFFMFSWERISDWIPRSGNFRVPTQLERLGDFSQTRVNGQPITLYDPFTLINGVRQPIPGNDLRNLGRPLNPAALAMLKYFPLANQAFDSAGNNFNPGANPQTDLYDAFTYQVDQVLNTNNRLTATVGRNNRTQRQSDNGITEAASTGFYNARKNVVGGVAWTSVLSPSTVLNVRGGYTDHYFLIDPFAKAFGTAGLGTLGWPSDLVNQLQLTDFPSIAFCANTTCSSTGGDGNYMSMGGAIGFGGGYAATTSKIASMMGSVTKVVSRHSLKAGAQFDHISNDRKTLATPTFQFSPVFTQQNPAVNVATQGNAFADFLLGYPGVPTGVLTNFGAPQAFSPVILNRYVATYLQDDWRVNSRLTLNLGLRWDYESPPVEQSNRQNAGFDRSVQYVVNGKPFTGGLRFVDSNHRTPFGRDLNNFQPRVGAAYQLGANTVVRGGTALFYLPAYGDQGYNNGYSNLTQFVQSIDGNITPANTLSNPFPNGLIAPVGNTQGPAALVGTGGLNFSVTDRPVPHVWQYTIGVQRELPWNVLIDASYVGTRTRQLEVAVDTNYLSVTDLARGAAFLNTRVPNPYAGILSAGTPGGQTTTTNQQLLLPFPQFFGSVTAQNIPIGYNIYDALQVRVEHRFSHRFSAIGSLTFSKNREAVNFLNPQDADPTHTLDPQNYPADKLLKQITVDDTPFRSRLSGIYQLPDPKGSNRLLQGLAGGWQVNAIATIQVGTPVASPSGAFSTGVDPKVAHPTAAHYFNTCYLDTNGNKQNCALDSQPAWIQQPPFTLNTLPARMASVRLQRPMTLDLSLFKSFAVYQQTKLQFRFEAFNLTNVTNLAAPNTSLTSTSFGQQATAQVNDPRTVQLALKLQF